MEGRGNLPFCLSQGHQICGTGLGRGWGGEGTTGRECGQAWRKSNHGEKGTKRGRGRDISVLDLSFQKHGVFPQSLIL